MDKFGDSDKAFCPSTTQGTSSLRKVGGDYLKFNFTTWASYLENGYTEYIEVCVTDRDSQPEINPSLTPKLRIILFHACR